MLKYLFLKRYVIHFIHLSMSIYLLFIRGNIFNIWLYDLCNNNNNFFK